MSQPSFDQVDKAIIESVKEYLAVHGFVKTLKQIEAESLNQKQESANPCLNLFKALDQGDSQNFFQSWQLVPKENTVQLNELRNLEFFVRVYFTIYPCHQINRSNSSERSLAKYKKNMEEFKTYLDQEGASFSRAEEVLPFFALPYIPNPSEHQAFKIIFTNKWLQTLKDRIKKIVGKSESNEPYLRVLFEGGGISSDTGRNERVGTEDKAKIQELERQLVAVSDENAKLQQKILNIEDKYDEYIGGLMKVARDMFRVIENGKVENITEETVTQVYMALSCFDKSLKISSPRGVGISEIDYSLITKDLSSLKDENLLCALLQALRWRLTRTARSLHKQHLQNFIEFNILGTSKPQKPVLEFLFSSSIKVKEYTLKFLNVMTSENTSREYLLLKPNIINLLLSVLYSEKQDTPLRQSALGVLQKLSLKKNAQIDMIRLDVLDWLLKLLKSSLEISVYTLEYSTALLMNLSLRTLGKEKLCKSPNEVMTVLIKYMASDNNQVRTYINGTLYSILTKKVMKDAAGKAGLEKKLKAIRGKVDENIKRQINFILEQMKQEENNCPTDEGEEEPEELDSEGEEDEEVGEFDDMEDLINVPGLPTGEELIGQRYLLGSRKYSPKFKEVEEKKATEKFQKKSEQKGNKVVPVKEEDYSKVFKSNDRIPRTPAN